MVRENSWVSSSAHIKTILSDTMNTKAIYNILICFSICGLASGFSPSAFPKTKYNNDSSRQAIAAAYKNAQLEPIYIQSNSKNTADGIYSIEEKGKPSGRCPFGAFHSSKATYNYDAANPGIDMNKISKPWARRVNFWKINLLCKLLRMKYACAKSPSSSGTRKLKSFDPEWVARAYNQIQPKHAHTRKVNKNLEDGDMRWELSRRLAEQQVLATLKSVARNDSSIIRLTDHFFYHKFYGQFRFESLVGPSINIKAFLYFWNYGAEELTQEFSRTMDFVMRGGCNKKNTIQKLAVFHKNFGLPLDFIHTASTYMRASVAEVCNKNDLAAFDDIFMTDLAWTGLLEGSKPGYVRQKREEPVHG